MANIDDIDAQRRDKWRAELRKRGQKEGFFETLGAEHDVMFTKRGKVLLVTFENLDHIYDFNPDRLPWGHGYAAERGWSSLGMMAHGWTWYRDEAVFDFFDRLRDDGFLHGFDKVVFYGASMGAYAACVFSAASPGSTVIAISPQATLDRGVAPWETRYRLVWRRDFDGRYGYAPDMVDQAQKVSLFYDPRVPLDAMHAALFRGDNIEKFHCRFMGHRLASLWAQMGVLKQVADACVEGRLSQREFHKIMRARRGNGRYERGLMARLQASQSHERLVRLCKYVTNQRRAPKFKRQLAESLKELGRDKA